MNARERAFVDAYCGDYRGNATLAARAAGYAEKSARVTGCRLLTKANIQAAIAKRDEARKKASIAEADELDEMLTTLSRSGDPLHRLKAINELNKVKGRHVTKVVGHDGGPLTFHVVTGVPDPVTNQ